MFIRERIMERLTERGYNVEAYDKVNNGVVFYGIVNKGFVDESKKVCPIVYLNGFVKDLERGNTTIEEVVRYIESVFQSETPRISLEEILNPRFILSNIHIGLQRECEEKSEDKLIKRECEYKGIEVYMYVNVAGGSFKITENAINRLSIPVEEMWRQAEKNTRKSAIVKPLSEVVCDIIELDGVEFPKLDPLEDLYVFSNAERFRGAAGVLDKGLIRELGERIGVSRFVMIPSSVHEVMLKPWPDRSYIDFEGMNRLVKNVNESDCKPEERLADEVYVIEI